MNAEKITKALDFCEEHLCSDDCPFMDAMADYARCEEKLKYAAAVLIKSLQAELKIYKSFPDEPLTLEELRGMDGKPVKIDDDGAIFYGLVSLGGNCFTHGEAITLCNGNFYQFADIEGNVSVYPLDYRHPPERSEGNA